MRVQKEWKELHKNFGENNNGRRLLTRPFSSNVGTIK
jgi:hypothetical protein